MFGVLDDDAIELVLRHQLIGHLGCHTNNKIFVVPISFAYHDNCIYAHTEEGMKIDMMRKNPEVCFETYHMENMGNWDCVIAWGRYEEIVDATEREEALKILIARDLPFITSKTVRLTEEWPFVPEDINSIGGIVFRIRLHKKTGKYEKNEFRHW